MWLWSWKCISSNVGDTPQYGTRTSDSYCSSPQIPVNRGLKSWSYFVQKDWDTIRWKANTVWKETTVSHLQPDGFAEKGTKAANPSRMLLRLMVCCLSPITPKHNTHTHISFMSSLVGITRLEGWLRANKLLPLHISSCWYHMHGCSFLQYEHKADLSTIKYTKTTHMSVKPRGGDQFSFKLYFQFCAHVFVCGHMSTEARRGSGVLQRISSVLEKISLPTENRGDVWVEATAF